MIHTNRVLRAVRSTPWAILPEKLDEIVALVEQHAEGVRFTAEEVQARIGAPQKSEPRVAGAIAVLPLYGVMAQRANVMTEISAGTSTERFAAMFREYMADPAVEQIVIDVDSPGGSVFGVAELASEIRAARARKPITAVANSLAASAGYWIASQAGRLVVTPGGLVGSIGVISVHTDSSRFEEMKGFKTTLVTAGKYKAEANEFEPLGDEARAEMQARVDSYYGLFVNDVAAGRGVSADQVRDSFGQGRVVTARTAKQLGMVDRVGTLDQVLAQLQRQPASRSMSAVDAVEIAAEEPAVTRTRPLAMRRRQAELLALGLVPAGTVPAQENTPR